MIPLNRMLCRQWGCAHMWSSALNDAFFSCIDSSVHCSTIGTDVRMVLDNVTVAVQAMEPASALSLELSVCCWLWCCAIAALRSSWAVIADLCGAGNTPFKEVEKAGERLINPCAHTTHLGYNFGRLSGTMWRCKADEASALVTSSWDHLDTAMIRASSVRGNKLSADPMIICWRNKKVVQG